jgi:hypothetical protein
MRITAGCITDNPGLSRWSCLVAMVFLLSAAILSAYGCAGQNPTTETQITLNVHSVSKANDGQLFYMVVRDINQKQFLTDTYQSVAGMVFADPQDSSVLSAQAIFPGHDQTLTVSQPAKNQLAVYFLFTNPGDHWKKMVSQPLGADYEIKIDKDQVKIDVKKTRWLPSGRRGRRRHAGRCGQILELSIRRDGAALLRSFERDAGRTLRTRQRRRLSLSSAGRLYRFGLAPGPCVRGARRPHAGDPAGHSSGLPAQWRHLRACPIGRTGRASPTAGGATPVGRRESFFKSITRAKCSTTPSMISCSSRRRCRSSLLCSTFA